MRPTVLLVLLALQACRGANDAPAASPVNPDPRVRTYTCEDGRTVEAGYPDRDIAVIKVGDHSYPLKAELAASGVRYVGYGLQWWTKGLEEARLSRLEEGETIASDPGVLCRADSGAR